MCAAKIAARRTQDLLDVFDWAVTEGHTVAMLTLTARHHDGMRLDSMWDGMQSAWARVTSGRAWAGESENECAKRRQRWETGPRGRVAGKPWKPRKLGIYDKWGLFGWARAFEVKHGKAAGWHPHFHVALVLEGRQTKECIVKLRDALWPLWETALGHEDLTAEKGPGIDLRLVTDADQFASYLTKSLAAEVTQGHQKEGGESRTPFEILEDLARDGDADDAALWWEYEAASRGRRQLTWSHGLRELAGLAAEQSDEEIAAEEIDGEDQIVMDAPTWRVVAPVQGDLLVTTERFGLPGAREWLRTRGLLWKEVHAGGGSPEHGEPPTPRVRGDR